MPRSQKTILEWPLKLDTSSGGHIFIDQRTDNESLVIHRVMLTQNQVRQVAKYAANLKKQSAKKLRVKKQGKE